ncbi:hypothetical protein DH2020_039293 [Rehmannia glutinosa]|uniref:Uncharacterized protein n=1 Tax=Rehmannia glutinosa TaxID=99300 RepID=A0ABR0UW79_REHGL
MEKKVSILVLLLLLLLVVKQKLATQRVRNTVGDVSLSAMHPTAKLSAKEKNFLAANAPVDLASVGRNATTYLALRHLLLQTLLRRMMVIKSKAVKEVELLVATEATVERPHL